VAYFDRTLVWRFSGVWDLPFGARQHLLSGAHGALGFLINHWNIDWIYTEASGSPMSLPDAYFNCKHPAGSSVSRKHAYFNCSSISVPHPTFGQWFNNNPSCW